MPKRPMLFAVAVLTAALLCGGPAFPQTPTPDAAAAARELVVAMRAADQLKALLPVIMQQLKPAIVQGRAEIEKDYDAIMPTLVEGMLARSNELVDLMATVYARNFTADEIRQVTAFYRGPVGQKFLDKMPAVAQESMTAGQKWGQAVAGDMRDRIVEELRKRGHKI
jgi:uncharacterized protein